MHKSAGLCVRNQDSPVFAGRQMLDKGLNQYRVLPSLHAQDAFAAQDTKTAWLIWALRSLKYYLDKNQLLRSKSAQRTFLLA